MAVAMKMSPLPNNSHEKEEQQHALEFSYMYGYPLLEYAKYVACYPKASTNTLYHDRRLSTSDDLKVIRPNVDTLYSTIFIDVSSHDLEVTVPSIPDRYWVFPFYDPYGNNIANIGSLQGHKPGKYLFRLASKDFGFFSGPPPEEAGHHCNYLGYINFPTAYGMGLIRIASTPATEDQKIVNVYQDQIHVTPVKRLDLQPVAPALDLSLLITPAYRVSGENSAAHVVLALTAAFAAHNQSAVIQDRPWIADLLAKSGIEQGISGETDLSQIHEYAEAQAVKLARSPNGRREYGNGWSELFPGCKGNFNSFYQARYAVGKKGYLALTKDQALYPSLAAPLIIGANEAILLRFSRRPALVPSGFWSLTAYNSEQYLVPNRINRYCLGDRDDMRFADGSSLADHTKDGEFHILLQPADLPPPSGWLNNWLPAPAGGGKLSITMRWYGAMEEMMSGSYECPTIEHISAITGSPVSRM
ncbi:hypothetical protein V499_02651 [Pseudogymnoascus sp. VKM F-103]|nr:hypothetical protein V499_02651 [Pseudogymnoascus sp. VKM F-103]